MIPLKRHQGKVYIGYHIVIILKPEGNLLVELPPVVELRTLREPNPTKQDNKPRTIKLFPDIEQFTEVQTWLKTVSPKTGQSYLSALKVFCEWCKKDPHQLILERDREKNNPDPNSRTGTRNLILDFRKTLERKSYAPKTINAFDGAVRSFFSAVLGREGMINIGNYPNRQVGVRKDLVPTLDELKRMVDATDVEGKFNIIFLAQTGMRPEDAISLKVGDVQRELDLGNCPLAISFLPEKDRNRNIGERISFLASDGINILKQYLEWRRRKGETITTETPLFISRSKTYNGKSVKGLTVQMLNMRVQEAAKKAGIGNDNGKYGRMRAYCLRKFFITQLTNHGVGDKIVNFLTCHMIGEVDRVYWFRRVDELREIYKQREKYLNPISGTQSKPSPEEIEQKIESKIKEIMQSEEFKQIIQRTLIGNGYESKLVETERELIELANKGFECQTIGPNKWLMKRKLT